MLIIFAGLPGAGKTTLARELARHIGAVYLRIDTIEQIIVNSDLPQGPMEDTGYRVGYAIAEDNLRLGKTVIADSVNPLGITRDAWRNVATRAGVEAIDIEVICSDADEHRHRVETRHADIYGLKLPTWQEVVDREYHPWDRAPIVIDTAGKTEQQSLEEILAALPNL